eukprot:CAMPEP_0206305158 /NCGR_PEP_ID=MMETSP0106_2-20121207/10117_1 /ASSEMBLY_ACC=CAM_ASM_000206 /TAXON_ID=81532 /ORGANISM="Acanthoeca-like sp., Strain 10tr" /LENGTH=94 /DNA_ID=CAMNT_0053735993 /DNA_START=67 /DNA_END=347 /DNA_ORIENTATION=-
MGGSDTCKEGREESDRVPECEGQSGGIHNNRTSRVVTRKTRAQYCTGGCVSVGDSTAHQCGARAESDETAHPVVHRSVAVVPEGPTQTPTATGT